MLGELLLNGLPKRGAFSAEAFSKYAPAPVAAIAEVTSFIQWARLAGTGLGYVDAHLLVSARIMPEGKLMTMDHDLAAQAIRFDIGYRS